MATDSVRSEVSVGMDEGRKMIESAGKSVRRRGKVLHADVDVDVRPRRATRRRERETASVTSRGRPLSARRNADDDDDEMSKRGTER